MEDNKDDVLGNAARVRPARRRAAGGRNNRLLAATPAANDAARSTERVAVEDWVPDVAVLMLSADILDHLTEREKEEVRSCMTGARPTLTVSICRETRCIVEWAF